jgi:hypothetical protein
MDMTLRRAASLAGALIVATIAALASYSHMRDVALRYGQSELIAALLPVSVDGMMVVATVALGDGRRNRWSAWLAFWTGVVASVVANVLAAEPSLVARCISAWPAVAFLLVVEVITRGGRGPRPVQTKDAESGGSGKEHPVHRTDRSRIRRTPRRSTNETRELAANLRAKFPEITQAELARRLGISATRLRQVERTERAGAPSPPVNEPST